MQAHDVMVSPVITIGKSAIVRDVARLLLEKRISAVPVVDDAGKVVGIVTEGDLIHRAEAGTERHDSWWLRLLTDNATFAADYVKSHAMKVEDVMTSDVITVSPETPLHASRPRTSPPRAIIIRARRRKRSVRIVFIRDVPEGASCVRQSCCTVSVGTCFGFAPESA